MASLCCGLVAQTVPVKTGTPAGEEPSRSADDAAVTTQKNARTIDQSIPAPRGLILDREGRPLAQNRVGYILALKFEQLTTPTNSAILSWAKQRLAHAERLTGERILLSDEKLLDHYKHRRWLPLTFGSVVDTQRVKSYRSNLVAGLILHPVYLRHYPQRETAAHIIGYVRSKGRLPTGPINIGDPVFEDTYGDAGLEKMFDEQLTGTPGEKKMIYSEDGKLLLDEVRERPRVGNSVVTTLDLKWQKHAEDVLADYCKRGAMVVIDIPTGDVLVLASRPSYDINAWIPRITDDAYAELRDDPSKPMYARAYQGVYPPASTFKPVVALTALSNNVVEEWTTINCPTKIKIGDTWFHNHSKYADGSIDVEKALARSNNCWFYQVGIMTGPTSFLSVARRLGFGSVTGLPLHGESAGRVPTNEWVRKRLGRGFTDGDTANFSIGQAWEATPLQVAQMMAGIANGTVLPRLRLIKQIQDPTGGVISAPGPEARNPLHLDPDAVKTVHQGLYDVIYAGYGTGSRASISYTQMAGKTGTGQWIQSEERELAWFAGFLPHENPRLAFAALYEGDPGEKVSGGRKAAPMIHEFFEALKDDLELMVKPPSRALIVIEEPEVPEVEEGAVTEPGPTDGVLRDVPLQRIEDGVPAAVSEEPLEPGEIPSDLDLENAPAAIPVEE